MPIRAFNPKTDQLIKIRELGSDEKVLPIGSQMVNGIRTQSIGPSPLTTEQIRQGQVNELNAMAEQQQKAAPLSFQMPGGGIPSQGAEKDVVEAILATIMTLGLGNPATVSAAKGATGIGSKLINFLASRGPQIGGAAAGGALARMGQEAAEPSDQGLLKAGIKGAAEMGGAEMAGIAAAKGLQKLAAPVAKKVTAEGRALLEFAKKNKLFFGPSRVTDSMLARAVDGGNDAIVGGRLVNTYYRRTLVKRFNDLQRILPEEVGKVSENAAPMMRDTFQGLTGSIKTQAKALSNDFVTSIGNKEIKLTNWKPALKTIQAQTKSPAMKRWIGDELAQIGRGSTKTAEGLETSLRQISGIRVQGAERKFLTQMRDAIKADFSAAGANMSKLDAANKFFIRNKGLLSSRTAQRLNIAEGMSGFIPDNRMTVEVFRQGNEGLIKQFNELAASGEISPQLWSSFKAQNLSNMMYNASTDVPNMFGARFINGDKLLKMIADNESALKLAYKPETIDALKNLARIAKATAPDVQKLSQGYGRLFEGNTLAFGSALWHGSIGPTGIVLTQGGSAMLAKSLMNPNGLMKTWLTTGYKIPRAVNEFTKFGIKAGAANGNQ